MVRSTPDSSGSGSRTLDRGLSILKLYSAGDTELSVREISERLAIPQASSYRLVRTLCDHGYLRPSRRKSATFELGLEILRLATMARESSDLQSISAPIMQELTRSTHETTVLLVPAEANAVCVRVIEGTSAIRPRSARVGEHLPYNGGATPMAILAHLEPSHRARIMNAEFDAFASQTLVVPEELESACEEIRRAGFAYSTSEYIEGTSAYAAPIFDSDSRILAAIGITGMSERVQGFEHLVKDASARVTTMLGGRAPMVQQQ